MLGGIAGVFVVSLTLLAGGGAASAAVLKADYPLNGDRASRIAGAPELTDLGLGAHFATERLDGTPRPVLAFPQGGGVSLATAGLVDSRNHSVAMVFRLGALSGYRRILDFTNGASDNGLYNLNGRAVLYVNGNVAASASGIFGESYVQLVITNAAGPGSSQKTVVYVNGAQVAAARTTHGFDLGAGSLRFFKDDPSTSEESAGALACVRVYDGVLTAREVDDDANRTAGCAAPEPSVGAPEALSVGRPWARRHKRSILVETGLTVSCPAGSKPCPVDARIANRSTRLRRPTLRGAQLGSRSFTLPGGVTRNVRVKLSRRGAAALRKAEKLSVMVSAGITSPGSRQIAVRQRGGIEIPRPASFEPGTYVGETSQGLPISFTVSRSAIGYLSFQWRAHCADGRIHTNTISLGGAEVYGGRFAVGGELNTLGMAHVDGRLRGNRAAGALSRWRSSAFDTDCVALRIKWHARRGQGGVTPFSRVRERF